MSFLIPRIPLRVLPRLLLLSLLGAVIAGIYGVVHDQVTFSLAPEYFTKFKFDQFAYANPGGGERNFVALIGLLATWWVGLAAGWFLGRSAVSPDGTLPPLAQLVRLFSVIIAFA